MSRSTVSTESQTGKLWGAAERFKSADYGVFEFEAVGQPHPELEGVACGLRAARSIRSKGVSANQPPPL